MVRTIPALILSFLLALPIVLQVQAIPVPQVGRALEEAAPATRGLTRKPAIKFTKKPNTGLFKNVPAGASVSRRPVVRKARPTPSSPGQLPPHQSQLATPPSSPLLGPASAPLKRPLLPQPLSEAAPPSPPPRPLPPVPRPLPPSPPPSPPPSARALSSQPSSPAPARPAQVPASPSSFGPGKVAGIAVGDTAIGEGTVHSPSSR